MKLFLFSQQKHFPNWLNLFKGAKVMPYNAAELRKKVTTIKIDGAKKLSEIDLSSFFDYQLFPENILLPFPEWKKTSHECTNENRKMKVGDTIVQQIQLPPLSRLSIKMVMAVRISEIIDEEKRKGFSYETLEGHVEKGISTFVIEEKDQGLFFSIITYSVPGNFLSKIMAKVFSLPYQKYCTRKALEKVNCNLSKIKITSG